MKKDFTPLVVRTGRTGYVYDEETECFWRVRILSEGLPVRKKVKKALDFSTSTPIYIAEVLEGNKAGEHITMLGSELLSNQERQARMSEAELLRCWELENLRVIASGKEPSIGTFPDERGKLQKQLDSWLHYAFPKEEKEE